MKFWKVILGQIWCSPTSVIGLIAAYLGGARFNQVCPAGVLQYTKGWFWKWYFEASKFSAITFGAVCIAKDEYKDDKLLIRHERQHTYQAFVLGPFFIIAYYTASLIAILKGENSYHGNWFEKNAIKHASEFDT